MGRLSEAFDPESYVPEPTAELAGRSLDLWLEDGRIIRCRFDGPDRVRWGILPEAAPTSTELPGRRPAGSSVEPAGSAHYLAMKLRESIHFVDFPSADEPATTITLLLDLGQGIATVLFGGLPSREEARRCLADRVAAGDELTGVTATFISASIDRPFTEGTPRHPSTRDMVGRRVEYTYSATERYEHIYLNDSFYTWHCLQGSEKGLADTDRCHYLRLADDLYLFVWREKIVPTLGVVTVDFAAMKTAGKILGYSAEVGGQIANFPVGARARILNVTEHGSTDDEQPNRRCGDDGA